MTKSRFTGLLPALLLPLLAGCSDLLPDSGRVPTSLRLADTLVYALEGERLSISVTVLDQDGEPIDPVPAWATPRWTAAGDAVRADGAELTAVASGESRAAVRVGDLRATATIRVNPSSLRLSVEGVHLTQSVQRLDGSIPLVAGRDALLRVFLEGDRANFFDPEVRVRLFQDGALVETLTAVAADGAIPTQVDDRDFSSSWNVLVPGERIRPGLAVRVEADPAGELPLEAGSGTVFPASGEPMPLDVRPVPPLRIRLVPIHQGGTASTGALGTHTPESFSSVLLGMYPVAEYDVSVRSTYTSSHTTADENGWSAILREIRLLRVADGDTRYYYGLITAAPTGIQGIGYIGYPAAVGSDNPIGGPETFAHELGHNFGRRHAPCGGVSGPDPDFPYAGGGTGHPGYDVFTGEAKHPGRVWDLMTYCDPTWISDYNYEAVLEHRDSTDWLDAAAEEPSLLVWGGVSAGGAVLEPALEVVTRPRLPARPGPYRIEGLDEAGAVLFSLPFMPEEVADAGAGERQFAFAVPARIARTDRLASLRLTGPAARATRAAARPAPGRVPDLPSLSVSSDGEGRTVLRWSTASHPLAAVRDASTGEIVALSRSGSVALPDRAGEVEVLLSDGVHTSARHVRLP